MQFSESWLRSFVNPALDSAALQHMLTMAGLEVEEANPVAPPFQGVVVAQILEAQKHPDADKLQICKVDAGSGEILQIVCGAPNAKAGIKIPCALVGAKLPGDFTIKEAKLRGVASFGMLCSAKELGLSQDHAGLLVLPEDAPVGQDIREYLNLDDVSIAIKLTPNRADCLSLTGIGREVSAVTGVAFKPVTVTAASATLADVRPVILEAPNSCPRYCGRIIRGVNAKVVTPVWMQQRLERSGIRSISALVDITNYVMLELGQPLHVFDDAKLQGEIHVRMPREGDTLTLLNGQSITPKADTLLIADSQQVLALAGIMGGDATGVTLETTNVFLEAAFFSPKAIAGRARAYGFGSEASHRYERGVDFALAPVAAERATELILAICGGRAGPLQVTEDEKHLPNRSAVKLRPERINKLLGVALTRDEMAALLKRDHLSVVNEGDTIQITPPTWRFDIEIEEDLVEEVARLFGYDNIPVRPPIGPLAMLAEPEGRQSPWQLRRNVAARGFQEVINFAFVEEAWERDFCGNTNPIRLANPIASQMSVMRSSLLPGLISNVVTNRKRQTTRVRLFEIGRVFEKNGKGTPVPGYDQPMKFAMLAWGSYQPPQWGNPVRPVDFYDMKAEVETLLRHWRPVFEASTHPALHPGRTAAIRVGPNIVGVVGELHPNWVLAYDLGQAPIVCELLLESVLSLPVPAYQTVSKQPVVARDLALVVDQKVSAHAVLQALRDAAPEIVVGIELFDVYQGKGVPLGRKSLAFNVLLQHSERTLEDNESDAVIQRLLAHSEKICGAQLRGEPGGA